MQMPIAAAGQCSTTFPKILIKFSLNELLTSWMVNGWVSNIFLYNTCNQVHNCCKSAINTLYYISYILAFPPISN
ncbi:hypothetical protein NQ314_015121 [Rhamnusium bicolor]|uniref:Uncharacterized protein n=1 Tax=Rhamnusium bicolor TaxID=1586634 RepID=A0AAV8WZP9_9CUCU|nr:hypothetical protein NQ314_015121 [Rhamnusium bicolor]